jgi:hypothetical protein
LATLAQPFLIPKTKESPSTLTKMGLSVTCFEGYIMVTDGVKFKKFRYEGNWQEFREEILEQVGTIWSEYKNF